MCELCQKHGEGKKWFLRAGNYADDLLSDLARRDFIRRFFANQRGLIGAAEPMERYDIMPRPLKPVLRRLIERRLRADHHGQVVTLAEARAIMTLVNSVFRLPCVCRRITLGGEHRYCLGFSMAAAGLVGAGYWDGPDGRGLERLTREEALDLLAEYDRQGLVHSVWTFKTPYIGGLCNCDAQGCRAMIGNLRHGLTVMHRGESYARAGTGCIGCGRCVSLCPFGAAASSGAGESVAIRADRCYGCGLCANACPVGAIELRDRMTLRLTSP